MRVPRGTRRAARTSPWRSKEASRTLIMLVDEQLPPARTVTGGAGGPGFAGFSRPFGLTRRTPIHMVLPHGSTRTAGRPAAKGAQLSSWIS